MLRLVANVRTHTGKTQHGIGKIIDGVPEMIEPFPKASRVEIEETGEGFFLFRFTEESKFAGDTWHKTIEEAKEQATFEFGIGDGDWTNRQ